MNQLNKWNFVASKIKAFFGLLTTVFVMSTLSACGTQNNISLITTQGTCADGTTGAPYCMGIQISNNNESGAQNWINSVNYPIKNIVVTVSGANNISYPGNGSVNQDPNGCLSATVGPGSTCTFYLQLNAESYAVGAQTAMNVNISYNVNDTWTGSGGSTGSTSLTVHQQSNLYGMTPTGVLNIYNYAGTNQTTTESSTQSFGNLQAMTIDNNSYGLIYTSNQTGIYYFGNPTDNNGNTNYLSSSTFESSGISNFNNLFSNGNTIYTATNGYGVWQSSFNGSVNWSLLYNVSYSFSANINALASSSGIYLISSTGNQVYLCVASSSSLPCNLEAVSTNGTVNDITASSTNFSSFGYTGLYVATTTGLWAESGVSNLSTNLWTQVTGPTSATNAITNDNSGNLYIGDISGNIWKISATTTTPNVATQIITNMNGANTSIVQMLVDNSGNKLIVLNSNSQLYSCPLTNGTCTQLSTTFSSGVVGLGIGSQITN